MKAERRHELQTNSLALWLRWRLPELWQRHGTKILLGLIALIALFWFIRWRINAPKAAFAQARTELEQAGQVVLTLRLDTRASENKALVQNVKAGVLPEMVKRAINLSDKPYIIAQGNVILGDYYWELALHRISTDGTTRPATTEMNDSLLKEAEAAYRKVLSSKTDQHDIIAHAHIGLGVIYETLSFHEQVKKKSDDSAGWTVAPDFTDARREFQAVVDDPNAPKMFKEQAQAQLRILQELERPVLVAGVKSPTAGSPPEDTSPRPTTVSSTTGPALLPVPSPTTIPALLAPITRPITTRPAK